MKKFLLLSIAITCISLLAASDGATTSHNSNVFQTTETDNFDSNQAKDRYCRNIRYATYVALSSFIANLVFLVPPKNKNLQEYCIAICGISSCIGISNMIKWLTIHIWPAKQASDIYCIDISEKLIFTFIALNLQCNYEQILKRDPDFFSRNK